MVKVINIAMESGSIYTCSITLECSGVVQSRTITYSSHEEVSNEDNKAVR